MYVLLSSHEPLNPEASSGIFAHLGVLAEGISTPAVCTSCILLRCVCNRTEYRRRSSQDGGFTTNITFRGLEVSVDNTWIVPYCPLLRNIFNAHINIECCNSVKSIKYVCKYVNKGSDTAAFEFTRGENDLNEFQQYQMGRSISSNEVVWRIFNFPIHERHPTMIHLSVHLENG
ncbi:hypothetical protein AVEN_51382-1 [Araneus ventricosus]|uniref:Uncharacterized protein n=1 Tax=Araneus ventricosus TaxID=182803 RepID=A0A4Y2MTK6_ARAVE|nr:hypothetical protein AVEN_51382-1 [Araneus ventricosus]